MRIYMTNKSFKSFCRLKFAVLNSTDNFKHKYPKAEDVYFFCYSSLSKVLRGHITPIHGEDKSQEMSNALVDEITVPKFFILIIVQEYTYNVPSMTVLTWVLSHDNLARPKSAILGLYIKSNKMLLALMSLWIICTWQLLCRYSKPSAVPMIIPSRFGQSNCFFCSGSFFHM